MLPALVLIPLVALLRIFMAWHPAGTFSSTGLPGACPMSAVALCAGLFLPRRLALAVPLLILFLSDVAIDFHYGANPLAPSMLARYALLALVGLGALALRRRAGARRLDNVLLATLAGALFFYVTTNALTWWGAPEYPQTPGGLWQALTVGLPGYAPTFVFFRNGLVSDLLYSMVFVACVRLAAPPERSAVEPDGAALARAKF